MCVGVCSGSKVVTLAVSSAEQLADWMHCISMCQTRDDVRQLSLWRAAHLAYVHLTTVIHSAYDGQIDA